MSYNPSLDNFIEYLKRQKRYSPNTLQAYKKDIEQLYEFMVIVYEEQSADPNQINLQHIRSWIAELVQQGLVAESIKRKVSAVKSYYKFLRQQDLVAENPTQNLPATRKSGRKLPNYIEQEKMMFLLDEFVFSADFAGVRDKTILGLFFATGIRVSELISLKLSSIDTGTKTLRVLGKGNKERILPLGPKQLQQLGVYMKMRDETFPNHAQDFLFLTEKGNLLYRKWVYSLTVKYLGYVTTTSAKNPHVLRHTFATILLNNGAGIKAISELLGHANLAATQIYTHNSIEKVKEAYKQAHPRGS